MAPILPRGNASMPSLLAPQAAERPKTIVAAEQASARGAASSEIPEYKVQPGDSLWAIATRLKSGALGEGEYKEFEVPELVQMLIEANPQTSGVDEAGKKLEGGKKRNPDGGLIYAGEKLRLPELEDQAPPPAPGPYTPNTPVPPWNNGGPGRPAPAVAPNAGAPAVDSAAALEANAAVFTKMLNEPSNEFPQKVNYIADQLDAAVKANPEIVKAPWFKGLAGMVKNAFEQIDLASTTAKEMTDVLVSGNYDASQSSTIHADVYGRLKTLMPFVHPEVLKELLPVLQKGGVAVDMKALYAAKPAGAAVAGQGAAVNAAQRAPDPRQLSSSAAGAAAAAAPARARKYNDEVWQNMAVAAAGLPANMAQAVQVAAQLDRAGNPQGEELLGKIMESPEFRALQQGAPGAQQRLQQATIDQQQAQQQQAALLLQQQRAALQQQAAGQRPGRLGPPDPAVAAAYARSMAPPMQAAIRIDPARVKDLQTMLDSGVLSEPFGARFRKTIELAKSPESQSQAAASNEMRAIISDPEFQTASKLFRQKMGYADPSAAVQAAMVPQK